MGDWDMGSWFDGASDSTDLGNGDYNFYDDNSSGNNYNMSDWWSNTGGDTNAGDWANNLGGGSSGNSFGDDSSNWASTGSVAGAGTGAGSGFNWGSLVGPGLQAGGGYLSALAAGKANKEQLQLAEMLDEKKYAAQLAENEKYYQLHGKQKSDAFDKYKGYYKDPADPANAKNNPTNIFGLLTPHPTTGPLANGW